MVGGREGWTLIGLLISALIPLAIEVSGQGITIFDSFKRMLAAIFVFQDFSTSGKMADILASMGIGIIFLLPTWWTGTWQTIISENDRYEISENELKEFYDKKPEKLKLAILSLVVSIQ